MLAINARYKPCIGLCLFCSVGRCTVTVPSLAVTLKSASIACFNSPLGPFTVTLWSASEKVHVTPFGKLIGNLPIRDMSYSINRCNTKLHHLHSKLSLPCL